VSEHVVIVGASVAGIRTAQALRSTGYGGDVTVVGEEPDLPYDRPPLSKQLLTGTWDTDRITLLGTDAAREAAITLRLGVAASGLDPRVRELRLADGATLSYDTLVIATGLSARRPPWATSDVHVLRTLADSIALRQRFRAGRPVVVIGAGFIGAEAAAAARAAGCPVTIVDPVSVPMERVAGPKLGALLGELHERRGVMTRFGVGVTGVTGTAGDLIVQLDDGTDLRAATVVVGIGAVPNVGWLGDSGLPVADGVRTDEYLRVDGHLDLYAAGDIARFAGPDGSDSRVEHWTNAADQARCVAHNISRPDAPEAYRPSGYVWSDQYDWKLQSIGSRARATQELLVGDLDGDRPRAAVLYADDAGRLGGAIVLNWPKALVTCRRLVAAGADIDDAAEQLSLSAVPAT
jgi:phthalate 3,4-dioxygenase ferredoxin reductase component